MQPPLFGMIDRKFIINMKIEGSFVSYANYAYRLLTVDRAPEIQLSACGAACLYLLKVSSLLTEFQPNLHKLTVIDYSTCLSCQNKAKQRWIAKGKGDPEEQLAAKDDFEEAVKGYVHSLDQSLVIDEDCSLLDAETDPESKIVHRCNDNLTFPKLIVVKQRLSFHDLGWDKNHPGYEKPGILPNAFQPKFSWDELVKQYNPHEKLTSHASEFQFQNPEQEIE